MLVDAISSTDFSEAVSQLQCRLWGGECSLLYLITVRRDNDSAPVVSWATLTTVALSTYTSESLTGPHCCAAPARYRSARQNICHACFDSIWRLIRPISLQHCTVPTVLYCVSVSASPLKILLCSAATD